MGFYQLTKEERTKLVEQINGHIPEELKTGKLKNILIYFSDKDTYIRKAAYLSIGKIYRQCPELRKKALAVLKKLMDHKDFKVRQTGINAAGEIGIQDFEMVEDFFDAGLLDEHHSVRNAVIGSIKKMGKKNPGPVLSWARKYLHHEDKEIRREICHGIELRGRTHPEDILPLLKELQHDKTARVKNTLVHVLGQIAYKKDCLEKVISGLKTWENQEVVEKAVEEIIDVHDRYKNFAAMTQKQARDYISKNF